MKNFLKENWFKLVMIIFTIFAFYWYELRPNRIQHDCADWVVKNGFPLTLRTEDLAYKDCLWHHGLAE